MKSIKSKIIVIVVAIVVCLSCVLGVVSSYLNYQSSMDVLKKSMTETAEVAADQIAAEIKGYENIAYEVGCVALLGNPSLTAEYKQKVIDQKVEAHSFERGNVIGVDGISIFDGNDYSERDYFKASMKGDVFISDPLLSKVTGKLTMIVSAPIWQNGVPNTSVVGVVYFVPNEDFLINLVNNISIGETGSSYILSKDGTTIAHRDETKVGKENTQEDAKTDTSLKKIAAIEAKMTAGETGFDSYTYGGLSKIEGYAPIPNTNGWSIGITAERSEFLVGAIHAIYITIAMVIIFIILGLFLAIWVGNSIANPIRSCAQRLTLIAQGDLTTEVPTTKAKDETGALMRDLGLTVAGLKDIIADISYHLGEMAKGNFTTRVTREYKGDFVQVQSSLKKIIVSLNETLSSINESSEQVAGGAEQVADGAQALSQGATEQASAVQELSATVSDISEHVKATANNAKEASAKTNETSQKVAFCNEQMQSLIQAMNDISSSSGEIGKIIKTIEDIAFQTNILALNAAVEAARAGAAGKGFAVVADEVRNLASKSAEAAQNTTALIEGSIKAVEKGTKIVDETAQTLLNVVDSTKDVTVVVDRISVASSEQAQTIIQVNQGMEQIASVVQSNSATAEQSAAASEELSGQAATLKDLVSQFKI